MKDKYVSVNEAAELIGKLRTNFDPVFDHGIGQAINVLKNMESADIERRGMWIPADWCMTICSECNSLGCGTRYCPNCGALMQNQESVDM